MTSPEWEAANEDDSDRFPQTSPHVAPPPPVDPLRSDPARVARYAEAMHASTCDVTRKPPCPVDGYLAWRRWAEAAVAVADEEHAALVAEGERLRGVASDHERWRSLWEERCIRAVGRAEAAEAKVAKVGALAEAWESGAPGLEWNVPIGMTFASHLRAALADAPTECGAEHPTNPTAVPCIRDVGHEGSHMSTTGCGGSVTHWLGAPAEQRAEGGE